eukprot:55711_1
MQHYYMGWDIYATLLTFTVFAQLFLLVLSIVYNRKIIQPNKDRIFWKIRRPQYFMFYIIITLLNDTIRCFTTLLVHLNILTPYWYSLLSVPLAYFGGITWGSIRLGLLYFDIKTARLNRIFLLSKHLTATSEPFSNNTTDHKVYKLKKYQTVTIKVTVTVIIFCIITLFLDIALGLIAISKLLLYAFILVLLICYTYFIFKLSTCCNCNCKCRKQNNNKSLETSAFRDDWLLLLELTIIWCIWIIGIVGAFLAFPFRGHPFQPVFIAFLTMTTRVFITLTMMIIPYKLSLRLNNTDTKTITLSTLKNILSTKSYFFCFVQHLSQELSIENLTFLVELWQFKYEEKYNLKPNLTQLSKKINVSIQAAQEVSTSNKSRNSEWLREVTPIIEYDNDDSMPSNMLTLTNNIQTYSTEDIQKLTKLLETLPWISLPLAYSISSNLKEKWKQCCQIYRKYLDENSYDSVNISYTTRSHILAMYYDLTQYKKGKMISMNELKDINEENNQNNNTQIAIKNDSEFNKKLITVFDLSLCDVVQNLRDSLSRFVRTEEFKLAH